MNARIHMPAFFMSYRDVVPPRLLEDINVAIDESFGPQPKRAEPRVMADMLREIEEFRTLERRVCAEVRARALTMCKKMLDELPLHVIRCASTETEDQSHCRHYDSHLLTLLVPLLLAPEGTFNGDLVVYATPRQSVSSFGNILAKILHGLQRFLPLSWRKALTLRDLRRGRCSRVPVEPGSVYVFNGFALQHANLDVENGQRRSLLIHYYDPGYSMGLSSVLRATRTRRDRLRGNMTGMY